MKKIYYQILFTQTSPLRIGNGQHEDSDSDLMLDGRGVPFIPGTSLAGIIRHRAKEQGIAESVDRRLFGIVINGEKNGNGVNSESSAILFGDAVLDKHITKADIELGRRDGVGLGEWGTVNRTSKFDFQIAETAARFCSIVEWEGDEAQYESEIVCGMEPILCHYVEYGIKVGARTTRGYGSFDVVIRKKSFDFPKEIDSWIDFNPYEEDAFEAADLLEGKSGEVDSKLTVSFRMVSPFAVRVNTARTEIAEDGSLPDTIPMENFKGNPVIPGTAWAGVFRHHMHDLLRDTGVLDDSEEMVQLDKFFGMSKNVKDIEKSKITFSEAEIVIEKKEAQKMSVMRTALDRFTASPRNAALFTNMVYFGGNGRLEITFDKRNAPDKLLMLLAACICDMHLGLISVGGESAIGRGIMQLTDLEYNGRNIFKDMQASIDDNNPLDWLKEEVKNA